MFHGTDDIDFDLDETNPSSGGFDVCTTDDEEIAEMYATRWMSEEAVVIEFEFTDDATVADEDTVRDVLDLEPWATTSEVFHAVDSSLDTLRDAGFDAVEYTDQMPGDSRSFTTTRIIQPVIEECDRRDV
ncbi:MAG: hypothetical protein U5L04_02400 [Trueperaceae bacterium]|nr:hypothetical protein [Trueperaceae bacterium]